MEARKYGQDLPGQRAPETIEIGLESVYVVVDFVEWEGSEIEKVFSTHRGAADWVKEHATEATGLYVVRKMPVNYA